jgi:signal transduction histidine kinase
MTKGTTDASASAPSLLRFATSAAAVGSNAPAMSTLAMLAHDFRNPLASLMVLIEAMHSAGRSGDLHRLDISTARALGLIKHLNDLLKGVVLRASVSGDPVRIVPRRVELGEVMDAALELSRPSAEHRSIAIIRAGLPSIGVWGDKRLLIEAVDNLLNNAVKHSAAGTSITCSLAQQSGHAVIQISDQGCGLNDMQMKRLFQPFARHLTDHECGTAPSIGLWITRLIAEGHGGHIEACSRGTDLGVVVELHLPTSGGHFSVVGDSEACDVRSAHRLA